MSERNDVPLKRNYKYKCLETCCTAVVDDKKWHRHCQTKHRYKTASHMVVKRTIVEVRVGKGPWMPYCETSAAASSSTASLSRSSATLQENVSAHGTASPDPGSSSSSPKVELTCESVNASLDASIIADDCRPSPMTALPESAVAIGCHQWSIHDSKPEIGIVSATPGIGSFAISDAEAVDSENISCTEADMNDPALFIRQRIDAKMINLLISGAAFQPTEYIPITETKSVQPTWFYKRYMFCRDIVVYYSHFMAYKTTENM